MTKCVRILIFASLLLVFILAIFRQSSSFYSIVEVESPYVSGPATLNFIFRSHPTLIGCQELVYDVSRATTSACKNCRIRRAQCINTLDETQLTQLNSNSAIPAPSIYTAEGVVSFGAANPALALSACQLSEILTAASPLPLKCSQPNIARLRVAKAKDYDLNLQHMLVFLVAISAAWLGGWFIVKYEHLHAHISHDHVGTGPQKYHAEPTPRIGGVAVMLGLVAALLVVNIAHASTVALGFSLLLFAGTPAFGGGLAEDLTKKVGVLERLLLTILSGLLATWLLGATLTRVDIPGVDQILTWLPLAILATAICVGGIANAINIIDGYNGLVSGFSILVLAGLAYIAARLGDQLILTCSLAMGGALIGFFIWNYPKGRIFLGDGGAYFLGFWLAELALLLTIRNPEVSPWFPVALLGYPIYETIFSAYRKKILRNRSPSKPDGLHFQMLIYKRLVRFHVASRDRASRTTRNSLVSPYIWTVSIIFFVPALVFWNCTYWLVVSVLSYCIFYTWLYWRMIRWHSPHWLLICRN